ncbi:MAG: hypothetical protein AAF483_26540, partial [Planctomycetota bacterium]
MPSKRSSLAKKLAKVDEQIEAGKTALAKSEQLVSDRWNEKQSAIEAHALAAQKVAQGDAKPVSIDSFRRNADIAEAAHRTADNQRHEAKQNLESLHGQRKTLAKQLSIENIEEWLVERQQRGEELIDPLVEFFSRLKNTMEFDRSGLAAAYSSRAGQKGRDLAREEAMLMAGLLQILIDEIAGPLPHYSKWNLIISKFRNPYEDWQTVLREAQQMRASRI